MSSSDQNDDSYQKDSLLDLIMKQQIKKQIEDDNISIDFANQVHCQGNYKKSKQKYIKNTQHTKEIIVQNVYNQRSQSLSSHINILSKEIKFFTTSTRKILLQHSQTDQINNQADAKVSRTVNFVRRKSCFCNNCGQITTFEKNTNTFQVRTQQSINTDLRLIKYNLRNPYKQQSLVRQHKIKQLGKGHVSSLSQPTSDASLQQYYNNNSTTSVPPLKLSFRQIDVKKKTSQLPVVLKQFQTTQKSNFLKDFLITQRHKTQITTNSNLPSIFISNNPSKRNLLIK